MQVEKMKTFAKIEDNLNKHQNTQHINQENLENKAKERELNI